MLALKLNRGLSHSHFLHFRAEVSIRTRIREFSYTPRSSESEGVSTSSAIVLECIQPIESTLRRTRIKRKTLLEQYDWRLEPIYLQRSDEPSIDANREGDLAQKQPSHVYGALSAAFGVEIAQQLLPAIDSSQSIDETTEELNREDDIAAIETSVIYNTLSDTQDGETSAPTLLNMGAMRSYGHVLHDSAASSHAELSCHESSEADETSTRAQPSTGDSVQSTSHINLENAASLLDVLDFATTSTEAEASSGTPVLKPMASMSTIPPAVSEDVMDVDADVNACSEDTSVEDSSSSFDVRRSILA